MESLEHIRQTLQENPDQRSLNTPQGGTLVTQLLTGPAFDASEEEGLQALPLLKWMLDAEAPTDFVLNRLCTHLQTLLFRFYRRGWFRLAEETMLLILPYLKPSSPQNIRYLYEAMYRRKQLKKPNPAYHFSFLRDLLKKSSITSLSQLALTLALLYGTDLDWRLADRLIRTMPVPTSDESPTEQDKLLNGLLYGLLPVSDDPDDPGAQEKELLEYLMLRYNRFKSKAHNNQQDLSDWLKAGIPTFPDWLATPSRFSTLAQVFDEVLDDNFDRNLKLYLSRMPRTRAAAEEIMEQMKQWDEWELYRVLLQDYLPFLSGQELRTVTEIYGRRFITPLDSILDEAQIPKGEPDDGA